MYVAPPFVALLLLNVTAQLSPNMTLELELINIAPPRSASLLFNSTVTFLKKTVEFLSIYIAPPLFLTEFLLKVTVEYISNVTVDL